jgi:hypothetical protein
MTTQARTGPTEQPVEAWTQLPLWLDDDWQRLRGNLSECWSCSVAFYPESSPSDTHCWQCAEELEAEASE